MIIEDQSYNQPAVDWMRELITHKNSLGEAGIGVLEQQEKMGRHIIVEGRDYIPKDGKVIAAANHFVRMSDPIHFRGKYVLEDLFSSVGLITREIKRVRGHDTEVFWTPGNIPGKMARYPSGGTTRDVIDWFRRGGAYVSVTDALTRPIFFSLFRHAKDVMPVPKSNQDMLRFMRTVSSRIESGDVLGIFPEGESSAKLKLADRGVSVLAGMNGAVVLPIAQFAVADTLTMRIGEPIPAPTVSQSTKDHTQMVMTEIARLLPEKFHGEYASIAASK